ncbi:MAG: hypothetical protein Kow0065_20680 [Methylomicrobium sp.]
MNRIAGTAYRNLRRYLALTVFVIMLLFALLLVYFVRQEHFEQYRALEVNTAATASINEVLLQRVLVDIDRFLLKTRRLLSQSADDQTFDFDRLLSEELQVNPELMDLLILDRQGNIRYWTGTVDKPDIHDRPYFLHHATHPDQERFHLSAPALSRVHAREYFIALSRPYFDDRQQFDGVLVAIISVDRLAAIFEQVTRPSGSTLIVMNDRADVWFRIPRVQGDTGTSLGAAFERYRRDKQTQGIDRSPFDGNEYFFSVKRVDDFPLLVLSSTTVAPVKAADHLRIQAAAALFVTFGIVLSFLLHLLKRQMSHLEQTNDSLQESRANLEALFENMSNAVAVYQAVEQGDDFVFVEMNRAAEQIEHIERHELIGKRLGEIFPAIERFGLTEVLRRVWRTGIAEHFPLSFYRDQRIAGWRDNYIYKLPNGHIVAIYDDVTEKMQLEAELRQSHELLHKLSEQVPGVIYQYRLYPDGKACFPFASDAIVDIYETTPEQVREDATEVLSRIHPDDYQGVVDSIRESARTLQPWHYEYRVVLPKQGVRWRSGDSRPEKLSDGSVLWHGFITDITERKLRDREIQELNRDFNSFLENTSDFVYFKDQNSRIRFCSKTMAVITGHSDWRDLVGKHDFDIFPEDTARIYYEEELPIFRDGTPLINKTDPYYDLNGKIRWINTNKWPVFDDDGRTVIGVFGISRDVTQQKRVEDELKRSNDDLEQFAYSVSHDMRQPLRMVSGHLQLLASDLGESLDEDSRINLSFALDGAKRMDAMIVSLLDYSRVGRKTDPKAWLSSQEPLNEALYFLKPEIDDLHAQIDMIGDWPTVFASHDELTRLFQNLLGNALKYHDQEVTPQIEIRSEILPDRWRVSIRDNGIGIEPEQQDRLFQFFTRLQPRTRFDGSGMGLALCRRIVEHHDGNIRVESKGEGFGSTFIFELPMTAREHDTENTTNA